MLACGLLWCTGRSACCRRAVCAVHGTVACCNPACLLFVCVPALCSLQAIQYVQSNPGEVCPAGWRPGDKTMIPDPKVREIR